MGTCYQMSQYILYQILPETPMIVCQWLVKSQWFSLGTPVSSTKNAECHDRSEILLKVALNTITKANTWDLEETRCVGTTRMSPPWILRRLANVSPFFNSLSNRLRITNYCLKSVSSSLLKFTRFKETIFPEQILIWSGIYNTCIWIRSPIPIKHYLLIVIKCCFERN